MMRRVYRDAHRVLLDVSPARAWEAVVRLGGDDRFYTPGPLWRARGAVERRFGGPGHRIEGPGRPLRPGDTMDFWRVVEVHPPTRLRVRAESLLPGTAHLEVVLTADGSGTELALHTEFEPDGPLGHAFWWAELPAHLVVFELMTRRLAGLVTRSASGGASPAAD